jgi:hypothetical protein
MFEAGEDGGIMGEHAAGGKLKHQSGTALGANVLGQQQNMRLLSLGRGTETKPCRHGHTQGILRVQAAHVQHDATEATGLEQ